MKVPVKITDTQDTPPCMQRVYKELVNERNAYVRWKNAYSVRPDNKDTVQVTPEFIINTINEFLKSLQSTSSRTLRKINYKTIYNEFKSEFEEYRNHKSGTYRIKIKSTENVL